MTEVDSSDAAMYEFRLPVPGQATVLSGSGQDDWHAMMLSHCVALRRLLTACWCLIRSG
ncbi:hypothetical protein [uncultured Gimesia sp.]|uniref:hypothetical protein n=1 Tax=uncultured Gimesia sp. TaxID=1678688 RepID=UPI0030DA7C61